MPLVPCPCAILHVTVPVRMAWSTFSVVESIWVTLMSAGILSPTGSRRGVGEGRGWEVSQYVE